MAQDRRHCPKARNALFGRFPPRPADCRHLVSPGPGRRRDLARIAREAALMTTTDLKPPMRLLTSRLASHLKRPRAEPGASRAAESAAEPYRRASPRIDLPLRNPAPGTAAARALRERGRFLARQDAWEELCGGMQEADQDAALTADLVPVALLLAEGARADAVGAARAATARGETRSAHAVLSSLAVNLDDRPHCPAFCAILALAHLDLAEACRADPSDRLPPARRRTARDRHLAAAAALADRFDPFALGGPLWAHIRCAVLDIDSNPAERVADDYEDLIDLGPRCPDPMRALGRDLLPDRHGSWEALELQARRSAARTADIWGNGAYCWVWMGALEAQPDAARRVDPDLFRQGLHDILDRHPEQHMANRLAAFTGITLAGGRGLGGPAARIADAFGWIVSEHLAELHPEPWARARAAWAGGAAPEATDTVARGQARALSTIAQHFCAEIEGGRRLVFGPKGMRIV